jgi:hypothetical protein
MKHYSDYISERLIKKTHSLAMIAVFGPRLNSGSLQREAGVLPIDCNVLSFNMKRESSGPRIPADHLGVSLPCILMYA